MKDILVHVDGSDRARARIDLAVGLAAKLGARLTGLFAQVETHRPSAVARMASDGLKRAAEHAADAFADATKASGLSTRWWQLPHGEPGYVVSETAFCARYFDLVVMGQADLKGGPVPEELVEQVMQHGGRPVLVVPYAGNFATVGERVMIAWNAGREASRAIHDVMPMLINAKTVSVISMRTPQGGDTAAMAGYPPVDILDHLAAWGIKAEGERLPDEDIGKMDMMLSRAFDLGADLLVMGGHAQESLLRSSGTRHVLRHMTLPILMSH